jgi:hypothetical protein
LIAVRIDERLASGKQFLSDMMDNDDYHYEFARLAVDKAKLCPTDAAASNPLPRGGIVIAKGNVILGWAAKSVGGEYFRKRRKAFF